MLHLDFLQPFLNRSRYCVFPWVFLWFLKCSYQFCLSGKYGLCTPRSMVEERILLRQCDIHKAKRSSIVRQSSEALWTGQGFTNFSWQRFNSRWRQSESHHMDLTYVQRLTVTELSLDYWIVCIGFLKIEQLKIKPENVDLKIIVKKWFFGSLKSNWFKLETVISKPSVQL